MFNDGGDIANFRPLTAIGTAATINEAGEIVLAPGPLGAEDIFLAIPTNPPPPTGARIVR